MAKKLYVGNLNYRTTDEVLKEAFQPFGEVQAVNVITDRETGRSKGFAFVEMATEEAAQAAITGMNGKNVDGRDLTVAEARPQNDRGPRRDDRGGGGGGGRRW
jgi:cold-inducible RNA-binding protein